MVKNITAATRNQQGVEKVAAAIQNMRTVLFFFFHEELVLKARPLYQSITCKPSSDH